MYIPNESSWIPIAVEHFCKEVDHLVKTRGISFVVQYVKTSRNMIMRDLSGSPLEDNIPGIKSKKGIPSWLSEIYFKDNIDRVKVLTTLLVSLRSVSLKPILKTDTITDPYKGTNDFISDSEFFQICRDLKLRRNQWRPWSSFHLTTKKGPGGQAILTSISEVTNLSSKLIVDIKLLGGGLLAEQIDCLLDRLDILSWTSIAAY